MPKPQINKVSIVKGKVFVAYQVDRGEDEAPDEYTLRCAERPKAALLTAMKSLIPEAAAWLEVPDGKAWATNLDVRTVSFSWKHGVMGAVLTCIKPLEYSAGPWIINTPHRPEQPYTEGGSDELMLTDSCAKILRQLLKATRGYIKGERAQASLPLEDGDK